MVVALVAARGNECQMIGKCPLPAFAWGYQGCWKSYLRYDLQGLVWCSFQPPMLHLPARGDVVYFALQLGLVQVRTSGLVAECHRLVLDDHPLRVCVALVYADMVHAVWEIREALGEGVQKRGLTSVNWELIRKH